MGQPPQSTQATNAQTQNSIPQTPPGTFWQQVQNSTSPAPANYYSQLAGNLANVTNPSDFSNNNNAAISSLLNLYFGANQAGVNFANQSLGQQQAVGLANRNISDQQVNQQFHDILNQLGLSTTEANQNFAQGQHQVATQGSATGTGMTASTPYAAGLNQQQLANTLRGLNLQGAQAGQQRKLGTQGAANAYTQLVNQLQNQGWQNQLGAIQNIANEYLQFTQAAPYTGGYNPTGG